MNTYWYCGIMIKGIGQVYSYISRDGEIPVGSYVEVPFGQNNQPVIGCVVSSGAYLYEDVPYPVEKTKTITRIATTEEYEAQEPAPFYNDDDREEYEELQDSIELEEWDFVFNWACEHNNSKYPPTLRRVIRSYELCLEQGMSVAALHLGNLYSGKNPFYQDANKAFDFYKIAAEAGIATALYHCGDYFYYGRHQEVDYAEAFRYFSLSALLGNDAKSLYMLGDMYLKGTGTNKNEKYAFLLYERALDRCQENNDDEDCLAHAQLRVGKCLLQGIGTESHLERAHVLLNLALLNFYQKRKTDNSIVDSIRVTKELIAEAQNQLDKDLSDQ